MRQIRIHEFGPPSALTLDEVERPEPAEGQVLIAVELAGVAFGETIVRSGRYPMPLPYAPGMEVGGRVTAVGPDVDPAWVGCRVVASTVGNTGGYAEAAVAEATYTYQLPDEADLATALAVFGAGGLATGILDALRLTAGETILITAAAGRIGSLLVQLAKAAGATTVIGAAGGPEKTKAAADFGADPAIDYTQPDWADQVRAATNGRGVDVVLDAVGGTVGEQAITAAADGGRIGLYGFSSGGFAGLDTATIVRRGLWVTGPLRNVFAKPPAAQRKDTERALALAATGAVVPRIHATLPLDQAATAHEELENRRSIGMILLRP